MTVAVSPEVELRARGSRGTSNEEILRMVVRAVERRKIAGECIVDVGCGRGDLYRFLFGRFTRYVGVDAVQYEDFPEQAKFCHLDLDSGGIPLAEGSADVVAAVETIEHLENPWGFMRQLVRLAKPGGWIIVTTPNQLSLLSLLTLILKQRFQAFQDCHYPAHLTALLEIDLRRMAKECGLEKIEIDYSFTSRIPGTAKHYPRLLSKLFPRVLSDNLLMSAQRMSGR